jgi:hypothetical protein
MTNLKDVDPGAALLGTSCLAKAQLSSGDDFFRDDRSTVFDVAADHYFPGEPPARDSDNPCHAVIDPLSLVLDNSPATFREGIS